MGGTFDPIHIGHLRMAIELGEAIGVDRVALIPAADPPHRETPAVSAEQRQAMVQLAIASMPFLYCDGRELAVRGPSYSIETVRSFRQELGATRPLIMAVGADAILDFMSWHQWQNFLSLTHIAVITRPGWSWPTEGALAQWINEHHCDLEDLHRRPCGGIAYHAARPLEVSSTDIRERIASGLSVDYLLPESVCDYIAAHQLYLN